MEFKKYLMENIIITGFDPEGFDSDSNSIAQDSKEIYKIFSKRGLNILRNKEILFIAKNEKGEVLGGVVAEWDSFERGRYNDDEEEETINSFSFDVATKEENSFSFVGPKLIDAALRHYESEKHLYEDMNGGKTIIKLEVINPKLESFIIRRYPKYKWQKSGANLVSSV